MNTSSSKRASKPKMEMKNLQTKMKPSFVNWMKMESGKNNEKMKKKIGLKRTMKKWKRR